MTGSLPRNSTSTPSVSLPRHHSNSHLDNHISDYSDRSDDEGERRSLPKLYPIVIIFRRTRKRHDLGGGIAATVGLPSFRLDDECDRAARLIAKLAPTPDMRLEPDAWDEIVHDGAEWLFPEGSLPGLIRDAEWGQCFTDNMNRVVGYGGTSKTKESDGDGLDGLESPVSIARNQSAEFDGVRTGQQTIPPDEFEAASRSKAEKIRGRMEEAQKDAKGVKCDDVEAATIRGMIQKALGLAFVRCSKVVMGVSLHAGSGIVISRLPDGTWSAPSAIGVWGLGIGIQFGLEVADYIFVLQTEDSLSHFRQGGSFTIGGNVGAAVGGLGREAYGAASVGGNMCTPTQEYVDDKPPPAEIAPIVAYAKSQGLYFGVSLEGSKIFAREDINTRTYKFMTGSAVSSRDILGGMVATPPEAEDLYASLHSVEFTHEIASLPRPPEVLRKDSQKLWHYETTNREGDRDNSSAIIGDSKAYSFFSTINDEDIQECSEFETKFKKFLYGGVSVQRLVPNAEFSGGKTRRERRTLWLMLPEVGALRMGFISKLNDGDGNDSSTNNRAAQDKYSRTGKTATKPHSSEVDYETDDYTDGGGTFASYAGGSTSVYSTDYTDYSEDEDSTIRSEADTGASAARHSRSGNVNLSSKHSMALTDVTCLSQEPKVSIRFSPDDTTEHLRVISIEGVGGISMLFLANSFREAELLMCGIKLLLERETIRLGVRGGVSIIHENNYKGGRREPHTTSRGGKRSNPQNNAFQHRERKPNYSRNGIHSDYDSSSDEDESQTTRDSHISKDRVPEGRKSWSKVPGRHYLRDQASRSTSREPHHQHPPSSTTTANTSSPTRKVQFSGETQPNISLQSTTAHNYRFGVPIVKDIASKISLPLPLPLSRVLMLDSSSPVITKWEVDRGDKNVVKTSWKIPNREIDRHKTENQLIASGSMTGSHRTSSYERLRNGVFVNLTETHIVDADDNNKLALTFTDRAPRRGFSVKVRILFRASSPKSCEATILAEVCPMGKNMSNQVAVHKAYCLVLSEVGIRYGTQGKGLLAGFLGVINDFPTHSPPSSGFQMEPNQTPPNQSQRIPSPNNNYSPKSNNTSPSQVVQDTYPVSESITVKHELGEKSHTDKLKSSRSYQPQDTSIPFDEGFVQVKPLSNATNTSTRIDKLIEENSSTNDTSVDTNAAKDPALRKGRSRERLSEKERERALTPALDESYSGPQKLASAPKKNYSSNDFADMPGDEYAATKEERKKNEVTIEVKPLPKIRLSLMPAPREEDEEEMSGGTPVSSSVARRKNSSKRSSRGRNSRDRLSSINKQ